MTVKKLKSNKKLEVESKTAHDLFLFVPIWRNNGMLLKSAPVKSDAGKELRGLFHNFIAQLKINLFFFQYLQAIYFAHTI